MRSLAAALLLATSMATALAVARPAEVQVAPSKRQITCATGGGTMLVEDGDVRGLHYHIQISSTLKCSPEEGAACAVRVGKGETKTIGWSADASANGWISGGFEVSKSVPTAEMWECNGGSDDPACIWQWIYFDEYTVQNFNYNSCNEPSKEPYGDTFRMRSPLKNTNDPYCVFGADYCGEKFDSYWAKN